MPGLSQRIVASAAMTEMASAEFCTSARKRCSLLRRSRSEMRTRSATSDADSPTRMNTGKAYVSASKTVSKLPSQMLGSR
jgi:hypothetical protein